MLDLKVEEYVCVDKNGKRTDDPEKAILHGYMDVLCDLPGKNTTLIVDWKSGRWEKDNEFERHKYALLGRAVYPQNDNVIFQLFFLRTGHVLETQYRWDKTGKSCTIMHNGGPSNTVYGDKKDPILEYFNVRIQRINRTAPKPRPGKHCEKWYGKPCQCLGVECPLSANLPNVVEELAGTESELVASLFLDLIQNPAAEMSKEEVALAFYASAGLKKNLNSVNDAIQEWSRINGTFQLGDSTYGWFNKDEYTVDEPFALETLVEAGLPYDVIAKCVNISKTSLGKLSKKQYPALVETLNEWAITSQKGKPKFGVISDDSSPITREGDEQTA